MNRRLAAAATALLAGLIGGFFLPSGANAAGDAPITDIGIAAGTVVNGPVTLRPTVADGADVAAIKLEAVAGSFDDLSQGDYAAPWEITFDPLNFLDQNVTLTLIAVDSAGNGTRSEPVTVYVDRWGPSYTIDNPAEPGWGWYVSVHQPIRISASDRAGLDRVELVQKGKVVRSVSLGIKTSGKASLSLDPATKNGGATVTIRLFDRFGNVTSNDFWATVDNDKPTGVFRPSGTYLKGTIDAWPFDQNDNTYVRSMRSYLDDHKGGYATTQYPLDVWINTRVVKDGKHTLSFELTDLAGNTGAVRRTVYIDNTVPSVSLSSAPKNKAKLKKKVTLKAKASDKYGVAKVQLLVNGKVAATDTKAGYQFTLNPKKYGKKFTVQLRAYDKAGNVRYSAKRSYSR
ncbi:Ig-like domain-containing protein [Actinoplanes sp. N902-109]|uniref:Ig-like domain-containing protein n=1 Tax=Actinoplanes sp. (strain N902-109) TaxID=649831 RepID=UPI000329369F|nr:Ig-like domain-containing protein [Actinoplanes sp. N902-109]AGL13701.1 fibronectin type III domain-containing protein [Actinoplanes sp. N902-109]